MRPRTAGCYVALNTKNAPPRPELARLSAALQVITDKKEIKKNLAMLGALTHPVLIPIIDLLVSALLAEEYVDRTLEKVTKKIDYVETLIDSFMGIKTAKGAPLHPGMKDIDIQRITIFIKFFAAIKELHLDKIAFPVRPEPVEGQNIHASISSARTENDIKKAILEKLPQMPAPLLEQLTNVLLVLSQAEEKWRRARPMKIVMEPETILLSTGRPIMNTEAFTDQFGALLRSNTLVADKIILLRKIFVVANWQSLIDVEKLLDASIDHRLVSKFKQAFEREFDRDIVGATCDSFKKALKGIPDKAANLRIKRCDDTIASKFNYAMFDKDILQRTAAKAITSARPDLLPPAKVEDEKKKEPKSYWWAWTAGGTAAAGIITGIAWFLLRGRGGPNTPPNDGRNPGTVVGP